MEEDLSTNIFFKTLKHNHSKLYSEAEKNCWLICIPHSKSCVGLKLTKDIFETHILQASPYFQGEYISVNKKTVDIEENLLKTRNGFAEKRQVKILFEELFYNKDYKSFRVICIECPLEGGSKVSTLQQEPKVQFPHSRTYDSCKSFLESFPINKIVLSKIGHQIEEFNKTYVLVKGFEQHAAKKVEAMCGQVCEALIIANPDFRDFHRTKNPQLFELTQMVESYVIGALHENLFGGLCSINAVEDEALHARILRIQPTLTLAELGIRKQMECEMPEAVKELNRLNSCVTPLEKLLCIQGVNESITQSIADIAMRSEAEGESMAITTDDLIPLMLFVIVQSAPEHLYSNLAYMDYFTFSNISTTSLGFTLVTFRAAIEYLQSEHIAPTENTSRSRQQANTTFIPGSLKRSSSTSRDESLAGLDSKGRGPVSPRDSSKGERRPDGGRDRSERVTEGVVPNLRPPPAVIKLNQDEQLGDFLSMLREESDVTSRVHFRP